MTHRKQKAGEDDGTVHPHKVTTDKGKQRAREEDDRDNTDAYGEWVTEEEAGTVSNMQFRYSKLTDLIVRSIWTSTNHRLRLLATSRHKS